MLFNLNFYQKLKKNWGDHYFRQNNLNLIWKSSNLSSLIMFPKQKFFLMKSFQLPKGIQHRLCTFCDFWRQDWWDMKQKSLRSNAESCFFFQKLSVAQGYRAQFPHFWGVLGTLLMRNETEKIEIKCRNLSFFSSKALSCPRVLGTVSPLLRSSGNISNEKWNRKDWDQMPELVVFFFKSPQLPKGIGHSFPTFEGFWEHH